MKKYLNPSKLPLYGFLLLLLNSSCGIIGNPPFVLDEVVELQECWSTAGAVGHADENAVAHLVQGMPPQLPDDVEGPAGEELLNFDGLISLRDNTPKGTYQVRYPIRQQFFFLKKPNRKYDFVLTTRWKIPDTEKYRIRIALKRYSLDGTSPNERVEVLTVLDSDEFRVGNNFQENSTSDSEVIDFTRYAYYVEAQFISKQNPGLPPTINNPVPSLAFLQICAGSLVE